MHRNALSFCGIIRVERVNKMKSRIFIYPPKFILILLLKEALTVVGCFFHLRKVVVYLSKKLTIKQKKFADEYIISGNATEAAIKAGYKESSARSIGNENLTKPDIKSYIDERMKELDDKKIAEQKEVLAFYTSVMRGEVREPMAISNGMGEDIKMVIPSAATRKSAADSLAKAHGMFIQKLEIEAETVVIKDDIDE